MGKRHPHFDAVLDLWVAGRSTPEIQAEFTLSKEQLAGIISSGRFRGDVRAIGNTERKAAFRRQCARERAGEGAIEEPAAPVVETYRECRRLGIEVETRFVVDRAGNGIRGFVPVSVARIGRPREPVILAARGPGR